jgi:ferredoxin-type protein NapH
VMNAGLLSDTLSGIVVAGLIAAGILCILIWIRNRTRKVSILRFFIQIAVLVLFYYSFTMALWLNYLLAIIFLATLFTGRFFCGWLCPFGFYLDLVTLFRKAVKKGYTNLPEWLNKNLHRLRYVILLGFIVVPFFLAGPLTSSMWPGIIQLLGVFNPIRILLGPMVPVIAPWQVFGSNLNFPYVDQIVHYSSPDYALVNVFIFIAFAIVSSFIVRRFWCRFCPTGASVAVVNRFRGFRWMPILHLSKDEEKCTKCGICRRVCPVQVTEVHEKKGGKITTSMCMLCLRCVEMCPQKGCLKLEAGDKTLVESRNWLEPATV